MLRSILLLKKSQLSSRGSSPGCLFARSLSQCFSHGFWSFSLAFFKRLAFYFWGYQRCIEIIGSWEYLWRWKNVKHLSIWGDKRMTGSKIAEAASPWRLWQNPFVPGFGDIDHHLQVSVGDYIPNSWVYSVRTLTNSRLNHIKFIKPMDPDHAATLVR